MIFPSFFSHKTTVFMFFFQVQVSRGIAVALATASVGVACLCEVGPGLPSAGGSGVSPAPILGALAAPVLALFVLGFFTSSANKFVSGIEQHFIGAIYSWEKSTEESSNNSREK